MIKIKGISDMENRHRKIMLSTAIIITLLLVACASVYAWFSNQRSLATMTKVQSPVTLTIGAGNKEDSKYIDLGGIDVEGENTSKDFVFCVQSASANGNYKIQLAHTTNIAFTYKIYSAKEVADPSGDSVVTYYSELENKDFYYKKGTEISGAYLNQDADSKIANSVKHTDTYGAYNNVQKNAEPLYWQNSTPIKPASSENGFVDYYILEVNWVKDSVKNDKETDMVYISAGMVN
ncbi:MAG: hypothetical protein ACI396_08850 [Acutalibacteraceae bacterium]